MLKPWANISILPAVRFGAMSLWYTDGCTVSGASIMMTSASLAASATLTTRTPAACALAADVLPVRRPMRTSTPLSLRFSACA